MVRRGISLLEVLISMFILLIGLLGVAALIPVGRIEIEKADQYDRASTLGRAAFREVHIRGFLQPCGPLITQGGALLPVPMWMTLSGGQPTGTVAVTDVSNHFNGLPITALNMAPVAYCLDPWGMMSNVTATGMMPDPTYFPAYPATGGTPPATVPYLTRITVRSQPTIAAAAMTLPVATRVFQAEDDLVFTVPTTGGGSSQQQYFPAATPQKRLSGGSYSWLVTIVPTAPTLPSSASSPTPYNSQPYIVSTVVYYKRPVILSTPVAAAGEVTPVYPERLARVSALTGLGIGGGEVTLSTSNVSPAAGPSFLNIKMGQWIMLTGQVELPANTAMNPTNTQSPMNLFRWYKVVAADDTQTAGGVSTRNVTLAGPDWPVSAIANGTYAIICDGVAAVYEKIMPLERQSMWSPQ